MARSTAFRAFSYIMAIYLAAFAGFQPASLAAQSNPQTAAVPDLTIKVIEGEDGVNIIKTKSAVKPVVEVRDKNDLPVAGATVLFFLPNSGASATFAHGARSLTVVTNSSGRAAATAMNPVGTGSFKIGVNATFQGHIATTTITQTNYLTAAAAVAAGALLSGAEGGRAGTGTDTRTGVSTAVIIGIAAAAAAAAAAGIALSRSGGGKKGTISVGSGPVFGPPR
jgi:hypothetical protein